MLVDDMEDILKVWWRSDMIKKRKSYSPGCVGGWSLLSLRNGQSHSRIRIWKAPLTPTTHQPHWTHWPPFLDRSSEAGDRPWWLAEDPAGWRTPTRLCPGNWSWVCPSSPVARSGPWSASRTPHTRRSRHCWPGRTNLLTSSAATEGDQLRDHLRGFIYVNCEGGCVSHLN